MRRKKFSFFFIKLVRICLSFPTFYIFFTFFYFSFAETSINILKEDLPEYITEIIFSLVICEDEEREMY